jgi:hypothetical protein
MTVTLSHRQRMVVTEHQNSVSQWQSEFELELEYTILMTMRCWFLLFIYLVFYSFSSLAPILQMVQLFLSEQDLYDAVIDLPTSMNFLGTVIKISTHKKFSLLKGSVFTRWSRTKYIFCFFIEYLGQLQEKLPTLKKIIGFYFDVDKLFSGEYIISHHSRLCVIWCWKRQVFWCRIWNVFAEFLKKLSITCFQRTLKIIE